jgi:hypothetical protein
MDLAPASGFTTVASGLGLALNGVVFLIFDFTVFGCNFA